MIRSLLALFLGLSLALITNEVQAADQAIIDQVVNIAKVGCLLGNEFTFDAKANGDITFAKLRPGAEAGLHTNIKNDPGAPGIIDQQLKLVASQQIRDCMKPYIDKLAELILGQASQITSADASTALDLGDCPDAASLIFDNEIQRTKTFLCSCPAFPTGNTIWGTSVYSLQSPICKSALHAGVYKKGAKSQVLLRWVASPPVFRGTTRNDITSAAIPKPDDDGAFVIAPP
jgi:hypothetical protein